MEDQSQGVVKLVPGPLQVNLGSLLVLFSLLLVLKEEVVPHFLLLLLLLFLPLLPFGQFHGQHCRHGGVGAGRERLGQKKDIFKSSEF